MLSCILFLITSGLHDNMKKIVSFIATAAMAITTVPTYLSIPEYNQASISVYAEESLNRL